MNKPITDTYYKKKMVRGNVSAEYSSEDNEITITVHRKTVGGLDLGTEYWHITPQAVEPLHELLMSVSPKEKDS